MWKCDSCGALNADDIGKCGGCGRPLSDEKLHSEESLEPEGDGQSSDSVELENLTQAPQGDPAYSTAVNIRRIYIVLLTTLGITAVNLIVALYLNFAGIARVDESTLKNVLGASIAASSVIAVAGIVYSVRSKRLSRTQ